jgi:hypothetical protein
LDGGYDMQDTILKIETDFGAALIPIDALNDKFLTAKRKTKRWRSYEKVVLYTVMELMRNNFHNAIFPCWQESFNDSIKSLKHTY